MRARYHDCSGREQLRRDIAAGRVRYNPTPVPAAGGGTAAALVVIVLLAVVVIVASNWTSMTTSPADKAQASFQADLERLADRQTKYTP